MLESFTAGAQRALERAQARAIRRGAGAVEPTDLLAALVDEPESHASEILAEFGLGAEQVWFALETDELSLTEEAISAAVADRLPESPSFRASLNDAAIQARAFDRGRSVGTEHLLAGLISTPGAAADILAAAGVEVGGLIDRLTESVVLETEPLPLPDEITPLDLGEPARQIDLGRILDASANRAREGLRVVEDYVRFTLDDPGLTD